LKIRGNWGRLGNSSIGDWDYLGTINQSLVTIIGGVPVAGAAQVKLVNSNLVWETKETMNFGLGNKGDDELWFGCSIFKSAFKC
jgi:hypothetical protein